MAEAASLPVAPLQFKLHIPDSIAGGAAEDEHEESLFPHTPRLDDRCFATAPPEELIMECLRPGSCAADNDGDRDWLKKILVRLGHAANERGKVLMAHTWFQAAYAAQGSLTELLSSTNMRRKLGQWHLCAALYKHVESLELSATQREVSERWHAWTRETLADRNAPPPPRLTADEELAELLDAPTVSSSDSGLEAEGLKRLIQFLRASGHGANQNKDFATAQIWFDCAFALSCAALDLLSAANMRGRLLPTSAVAMRAYEHVLSVEGCPEKQYAMAKEKLARTRALREAEGLQPPAETADNGGALVSHRDYF